MDCLALYSKLRTVVSSGSHDDVWKFLSSASDENGVHYLHDYLCEELPKEQAVCSRCESLLMLPLLQQGNTSSNTHNLRDLLLQHGACPLRQDKTYCHTDTDKLRLLLKFGAYPPKEICAAGYPYNRTRSTPLKRAVQSGSIHDVERLLTSQEADDVNWHPEFCVGCDHLFLQPCADCDTPLMAAVRRKDIAMMRLLIAHGANVSEVVHGDFGCRPAGPQCFLPKQLRWIRTPGRKGHVGEHTRPSWTVEFRERTRARQIDDADFDRLRSIIR